MPKNGKSSPRVANASEPRLTKSARGPYPPSCRPNLEELRAQSSSNRELTHAAYDASRLAYRRPSVRRPVASTRLPEQISRIRSAIVRCTGSAPHALLVGREQAIAGIAPSAALQAEPILYSRGRRDGRSMSARERRRAWKRDRSQNHNGQPRRENSAHDNNSMSFGCMAHPDTYILAGRHSPSHRPHARQTRRTTALTRSRSVVLRSRTRPPCEQTRKRNDRWRPELISVCARDGDEHEAFDAMECSRRADRDGAIRNRKHQSCRLAPRPWPFRVSPLSWWRGRFLPVQAEECRERLSSPHAAPGAGGGMSPCKYEVWTGCHSSRDSAPGVLWPLELSAVRRHMMIAMAPRAVAALGGRFLPRLGPLAHCKRPFFFSVSSFHPALRCNDRNGARTETAASSRIGRAFDRRTSQTR